MNPNKLLLILFFISTTTNCKEPQGLENCGNSCYMNSTVQCVYNLSELTDFIINFNNDFIQETLAANYSHFALLLREESIPKGYEERKNTIKNVIYNKVGQIMAQANYDEETTAQRDAQEFVTILLDHIGDIDAKPEFKQSAKDFIEKNFDLKETSTLACRCGNKRSKVEKQYSLNIPVFQIIINPQTNTQEIELYKNFQQCLEAYFKPEEVEFNCSTSACIETKAIKTLNIGQAPEYLIISLNRFDAYRNKKAHAITFPLTALSIKQFLFNPPKAHGKEDLYDLTGIILHIGATGEGHYIAYVKTNDQQWYECNDATITKLTPEFMQNLSRNTADSYATPYVFFYQKITASPKESLAIDLDKRLISLESSLSGLKNLL